MLTIENYCIKMAKVVVLGAGVSGHTCASFLKKKLGKQHEIVVVSPNSYYQWIPSNIWVGVGQMTVDQVRFKLQKVYDRWGIIFKQAKALSIHPEGDAEHEKGYVTIEYTAGEYAGQHDLVHYDYLVNAPMATCQGAAFEYILNVAYEISKLGLKNMAQITWISNEYELGDFGMAGAFIKRGGYIIPTKIFTESLLAEYGINWIRRAGVYKVEPGLIYYETLDGEMKTEQFDFAMLIPAFTGVGLTAFDKSGNDITDQMFMPNKFMKVDANYTAKPFEEWTASDWPTIYQTPMYDNIYAVGIAFAPPHPISKPMSSPNGHQIFPTPPRTGMPSGVIGKIVAFNIAEQIMGGHKEHHHKASMARMGAACIVSGGFGSFDGLGASMSVFPIVPDWDKYPDWGRDMTYSIGEAGLAGHWLKIILHYLFFHKAKGYPFWYLIPE